MENEEKLEIELWDKQPGEAKQWFLRFQRYYLYRGLARSVRRAYIAFMTENFPDKAEDLIVAGRSYMQWLEAAKKFNWKTRAEAWDESRNHSLQLEVQEASKFLMQNTLKAAESLVGSLSNPRVAVAAANSILDRTGLPTLSKLEVAGIQSAVSADELAKVKEAVTKWEKEQQEDG
jgi:hypothetical protein